MRNSRSISLAALAAALLLVSVPLALAAPGGGGGGQAKLTIDGWNEGAMGEIVAAGKDCSAGRPVFLYEQKGSKPDPEADKRLGKAAAKRTGAPRTRQGDPLPPLYLWLTKVASSERVYAEAGPRQGCAELRSRTIALPPRANAFIPECPRSADAPREMEDGFCHIQLHHDADLCPGFAREVPLYPCFGKIKGNPPWQQVLSDLEYGTYGDFRWLPAGPGRRVILQNMTTFVPFAGLEGFMKGPQYAEFYVDRGWSTIPYGMFVTPNTPIRAGELGGPLYLDFQNGRTGADVYIRGYLLKVR